MKTIIALAIVVLASGCVHQRKTQFIAAEFEQYDSAPSSSIEGSGFVTMEDGSVKFASGSTIYIMPVTTHTTETWEAHVNGYTLDKPMDPRAAAYAVSVRADAFGRFHTPLIPAGDWYVWTKVSWSYRVGYTPKTTTVMLGDVVHLSEGEALQNVVLSTLRVD